MGDEVFIEELKHKIVFGVKALIIVIILRVIAFWAGFHDEIPVVDSFLFGLVDFIVAAYQYFYKVLMSLFVF